MFPLPVRKKPAGFGLLELLVAVLVIAVLMALLVPAIQRGKRQAQTAYCVSNLRQIGSGLQLYMQEHGVFPPFAASGDVTRWYDGSADEDSFFAGPYLRSIPRLQQNLALEPVSKGGIFDCPSITIVEKEVRGTASFMRDHFDYGLNISLCGRRPASLASPSQTVAVVDGGNYARVKAQWTQGLTYTQDAPANPGGTAWNYSPSPIIYAHQGKANLLFLDGHVSLTAPEELTEQMFNGEN